MADNLYKVWESLREKSREILHKLNHKSVKNGKPVRVCDVTGAIILGGVVFPLSIGYLQKVIFRPLRITSNKRLLAPVIGGLSVAFSGSLASVVFLLYVNAPKAASYIAFDSDKEDSVIAPLQFSYSRYDLLGYAVASMVVFKVLGGRFRAVLPSSLIHPGAFARISLSAPSRLFASDAARQKLGKLGRKYGCHTCGRKRWTAFVGDHIPPNKIVKPGEKQHFFPQCNKCSKAQGAALSLNSKRQPVMTHVTTLRLYHLWLPLPVGLLWLRNQYPRQDSIPQDEDNNEQH